MSKREIFNSIFLRRRRRIIIDNREDINDLCKDYIKTKIEKNELFSKHNIEIKECNLLNCSLNIDNTLFEFENGKIRRETGSEEFNYIKELSNIVEEATQTIREKLNVALTLNENISKLGFCMDSELLKGIALYDEKQISNFNDSLIAQLKQLVGADVEYISLFPNFPQQVMEMSLFTVHFYRWLYYINICVFNNNSIPYNFEIIEKEKTEIKDLELKVLSTFIENEKEHLKYIPETINNKENLANICNLLLKHHPEPPFDVILPKFKNVNDVLRLALVLSGHNASDLGKSVRFKSFKQSERRLLMKLLNNCGNRYEDIMKYKNMWKRFFERIHPVKYKNIYPDLVNDLLGDYSVMRSIKDKKHERNCYNTIYQLNQKVDYSPFIYLKYSNNDVNQQYQECFKTYKRLKEVPDEVKEHVDQFFEKIEMRINKNKRVNNNIISLLNKNLIDDRIKDINNDIKIVKGKALQYRRERPIFNSKIVELISNKKIDEAAKMLSQRPGIYLRHLDELITKGENHDLIIELFEKVAPQASVKVLLSVKGYFQKRKEKLKLRAFLIKGSNGSNKKIIETFSRSTMRRKRRKTKPATVVYYTDKVKEPLKPDLCDCILRICDQSLIILFEKKPKLNGIYVSPDLQKIYIPQDMRTATSSLERYTKGSRFPLSFKNITPEEKEKMIKDAEDKLCQEHKNEKELEKNIEDVKKMLLELDKDSSEGHIHENKHKLFIWWTNSSNQSNDIVDLSVLVFDDNYENKARVSWNFLKDDNYRIYHSGDFIDGGNVDGKGVSEFIDLDTETILAKGGRYVVVGVISFRGPNLKDFPNCKFGWMERQELQSNEFFEPATVRQKNEIKYDGKAACPAIIDCKTHELIWIDTILAKTGTGLCIEHMEPNIKAILAYYTDPIRVSLYDLIHLHINARDGKQIQNEEELQEGDTAFVSCIPYSKKEGVNYIASSDIDIILSEYMS
ncbi:hypothetical protein PIROE2DRAFT_11240 [Piromyces sp. E2]|nr:hypothetical protein PIROE2DRAFT_11240 [Piromyces sp. E2]|eukprot:OUM62485.1 hypothetical protein PIROE2DRAFT_11240 [Piromyces sp. E2]